MLIQKSAASEPKVGDVVALKLVTGEEIVGKLAAANLTGVELDKPVVLQTGMTPKGLSMAFAPVMFAVEEDRALAINRGSVAIGPLKARQEISAQYIKATTGLEVPVNRGIIAP